MEDVVDRIQAEAAAPACTAADCTPACLARTAARLPDHPAYCVRRPQGWVRTSWSGLYEQVQAAARALVALGVQRGQTVCILGFNRPEWLVMAHAAGLAGARVAGIYWTSAAAEVQYIAAHSQCALLLVEDAAQAAKLGDLSTLRERLPDLRHVVAMDGPAGLGGSAGDLAGVMPWDGFMAHGAGLHLQAEVEVRLAALDPRDTCALIYTSGTTGPPKAVVLSHANLAWAAQAVVRATLHDEHERLLSYLPMAHVAEMTGTVHAPARGGHTVYFARNLESLMEHLQEVRPTVFFGVPRVWEKMHAALSLRLGAATGLRGWLARDAMQVARRWHAAQLAGTTPDARPGPWQAARMALARRLVLRKIQAALGLDQARLLMSGAAPIAADKLLFFCGLDRVVRELYGQSEISGPTTLSLPGSTRIGSVGKPVPGIEVRIAEDGEILARGPSVFQGYLGDAEATAATLAGGWLHSGDLGHIDADGYLYVTGRKKDLIITSGGKNISPANIESALMALPLVEHAVVVGDRRHYLAALLTLRPDALAEFARGHGVEAAAAAQHPAVHAELQRGIDAVNADQSRAAHIRRFAVLDQPLGIATGELTPTMKVRRGRVLQVHAEVVEGLYRGE
jgi:long-chain acyl-CoA synthetase